jgi:hypothetical protein
MGSNSATKICTQQSIKKYVDNRTPMRDVTFQAFNSLTDSNVIGGSTSVTVDFNTERWDPGFDFLSDTFTAEGDGMYLLTAQVRLDQLDRSSTYFIMYLITTKEIYCLDIIDPDIGNSADSAFWGLGGTAIVDMENNDTAFIRIESAGGANVTDIAGQSTTQWTYFHGTKLTNLDPGP